MGRFSSERSRLSAKRFNKFLERLSQAVLAVGLAIATAAIIAILHGDVAGDGWWWAFVGTALVVLSVIFPFMSQSEE